MTALILDANVLIGFNEAGWLDTIEFWMPEYRPIVPKPIWDDELVLSDVPPDWMEVVEVNGRIQVEDPGQLSKYDWNCIVLAEQEDGVLITADSELRNRAQERGVEVQWSASFAIQTFEECGISEGEYEDGLNGYISDARLDDDIEKELREAEK